MRFIFFIIITFLSQTTTAKLTELDLKSLSQASYWHQLLHYLPNEQGFKSEVISAEFFLSEAGKTNPLAELQATTYAFNQPPELNVEHARCQFPARYQWLKEQLGEDYFKPYPDIFCGKYEKWRREGNIKSISVVLASGYLSNPASIYGHLLLRFNTDASDKAHHLLASTLNFGAITPEDENMMLYILKGIFGGYEAGFTHELFYKQNHNYAQNELRDLWSYTLNLTEQQKEKIIAHSYELIRKKFVYYFAKENCAYQMARLLQLVVDEPLINYDMPFAFPSTVFQRLAHAHIDNRLALEKIDLILSNQKRVQKKYSLLSEPQQQSLNILVDSSPAMIESTIAEHGLREQVEILHVFVDYLEFLSVKDVDVKQQKQAALLALLQRPVLQFPEIPPTLNNEPHLGQPPTTIQTGLVSNTTQGEYAITRFRTAYYDLLSNPAGRLPLSSLSMLDLTLAINEDDVWIKQFDGVSIKALNTSKTGLDKDGGYAWQIRGGIEQQNLDCQPCGIAALTAGIGKGVELNNRLALYAMQNIKLQSAHGRYKMLSSEIELGAIAEISSFWRSSFIYSHRIYLDNFDTQLTHYKWENAIHFDRHWEVRFNFEKQIATEVTASFSYFF